MSTLNSMEKLLTCFAVTPSTAALHAKTEFDSHILIWEEV